jgi:hypothetical protein
LKRLCTALGSIVASAAIFFCLAPAGASAAQFGQCPAIGLDQGCQFLITISDSGQLIQTDSTQSSVDIGGDDSLIGIVNGSSKTLSVITLSSPGLFSFENDGLCAPGSGPVPTSPNGGCQAPPGSTAVCTTGGFDCSFPPTANEPAGYQEGGSSSVTAWPNGTRQNGYEGPRNYYANISTDVSTGQVVFDPPLQPGESTYFSLETPPIGSGLTLGTPTSITTTTLHSSDGKAGAQLSVNLGVAVNDQANIIGGSFNATSGGTVTYGAFSDPLCTKPVGSFVTAPVLNGVAQASPSIVLPAVGTYYFTAAYSGDAQNAPSASRCGGEIVNVVTPTVTTTTLKAGAQSGASLAVPQGTAVQDTAKITGAAAATASGSVTYEVFRDKTCTRLATLAGVAPVINGTAGPSTALKLGAGTYYWRAVYSGDTHNGASTSACGAETLVVPASKVLGLPKVTACFSKRHFVIHLRLPKGVKPRTGALFINGKLIHSGALGKKATFVDLRGLPKGTFHVIVIITTTSGDSFQDGRSYHTCKKG